MEEEEEEVSLQLKTLSDTTEINSTQLDSTLNSEREKFIWFVCGWSVGRSVGAVCYFYCVGASVRVSIGRGTPC